MTSAPTVPPRFTTIGDALSRAAAAPIRDDAVVCGDDRIGWPALAEQARHVSRSLRALGVRDGERVAVWLPNGIAWAAAFLGVARIGTLIPINVRYRAEELAVVLGHSRTAALLIDAGDGGTRQRELLASVRDRLPDLRVVTTVPELLTRDDAGDDADRAADPAVVQYTSGTTSRPKGVLLDHAQILRNAWELGARLDVLAGDRYGSGMPFFHVGGSVLTLLLALTRAATAVTVERFDAAAMLRALERERCTHFFGVESMCVMMLERPELKDLDLSAMRVGFVGGRRAVLEAVRERLCPVIVNRFGMTESSGNTCATDAGDPPEVALTTMGRPLPGIDVRIVDGEIRLRGWAITRGYLDDPARTAAAFDADGWFRTGDRGELDPAGRLIFLGRADDQLRVGSENVQSAEIEELIGAHPAVAQVAVLGAPDDRLGEIPVAFVELRAGARTDEAELAAFCRERAAGFKVPRRIVFMQPGEWPMTESGKIQKFLLRDRARA